MGCSPRRCEESDLPEATSHACIFPFRQRPGMRVLGGRAWRSILLTAVSQVPILQPPSWKVTR